MSIFATLLAFDGDEESAPLIDRGSHINPTAGDPRGGVLLVCGIPDHCHPDAGGRDDDEGRPVEFLRLFASEDPATYQGMEPGQATLIFDLEQVIKIRDMFTWWIDTRTPGRRALLDALTEETAPGVIKREDDDHAQH